MEDLKLAQELITETGPMIDQRNQLRRDANIYRNVIRHNGAAELHVRHMNALNREADQLQEEIDFKLAFAEVILKRAEAERQTT